MCLQFPKVWVAEVALKCMPLHLHIFLAYELQKNFSFFCFVLSFWVFSPLLPCVGHDGKCGLAFSKVSYLLSLRVGLVRKNNSIFSGRNFSPVLTLRTWVGPLKFSLECLILWVIYTEPPAICWQLRFFFPGFLSSFCSVSALGSHDSYSPVCCSRPGGSHFLCPPLPYGSKENCWFFSLSSFSLFKIFFYIF